ncbi:MAG: bifunctional 1-(5-phosphoribosyl)-5-((5-phosphoribosylamino)methylideneamino)imidazole-4-carboxamide isomerase/phosphoribosylanthranilate isomerase PriA [Actinobacteria bacterium]|nr:bifunctional 1-(5-phosphoribosyl)-5-((5-phosphoribosylamino)methylideneamino)imidazole-4-carboxamide isomerase/phosphoribosylanthranilate isomerase PriA [Actinomycetota bacterium]
MTSGFTLLAAVEVSAGATAIRVKNRVDAGQDFGDPLADARAWIDQGATWLHLADLDGGDEANRRWLAAIHAQVHGKARTQIAGGIAHREALDWALRVGFDRIVLDTAALADTEWVQSVFAAHGNRVVAGLDVSHGVLWAPGAELDSQPLEAALSAAVTADCPGYVVTAIDREATRKGPDLSLVRSVCEQVGRPVCVAGGIAKLEHLYELSTLAEHGVASAVLDAALYRDYFNVAEALAAVAPRFDPYRWGPAQPWGLTQGL